MVVVRVYVAQQDRNPVKIVDDYVDLTVIKQIPKGSPPAHTDCGQACSFHCGNQLEAAVPQVAKKQRALRIAHAPVGMLIDLGVNMTVDHQQIFPAVVVKIEKSIAEADERCRRRTQACAIAVILKIAASVIMKHDI